MLARVVEIVVLLNGAAGLLGFWLRRVRRRARSLERIVELERESAEMDRILDRMRKN